VLSVAPSLFAERLVSRADNRAEKLLKVHTKAAVWASSHTAARATLLPTLPAGDSKPDVATHAVKQHHHHADCIIQVLAVPHFGTAHTASITKVCQPV